MMCSTVKVTHFCFPVLTERTEERENGKAMEPEGHYFLYL